MDVRSKIALILLYSVSQIPAKIINSPCNDAGNSTALSLMKLKDPLPVALLITM